MIFTLKSILTIRQKAKSLFIAEVKAKKNIVQEVENLGMRRQ